MDAHRWNRIGELFEAALEQSDERREAFLRTACAGDEELYRELISLIQEDRSVHAMLDGVALDLVDVGREYITAGQEIGSYRILSHIGSGGMGAVYLAERADGAFEQRVALKLIKRGMDSEQILRRFRSERKLLARLQHPNIARLLDAGVADGGQPYFVMEYVEGEAIDAYCDRHRLGVDQRLALFHDVCSAVLYAHASMVVHRDLKPENILITAEGQVKLLDFGIAKALEDDAESLTQTGLPVMTPEYASPEQVRGEAVTTATDIYSLGVVLYELLSGLRPYHIENRGLAAVGEVVCTREPDRPSTVVARLARHVESSPSAGAGRSDQPESPARLPGSGPASKSDQVARARSTQIPRLKRRLSGDLDVICLKALQKEPLRRYMTMGALAEDVRRHLDGMPVVARPDTVGYLLGKFAVRHRWGVLTGAFVIAVITTLVSFYTIRLADERDRAHVEAAKARQTASFLQSIFEVSDPSVAKGETVTARTLLDEGAERVAAELVNQPDVQGTMMAVIGNVYLTLGLYDEAEDLTQRALHIRRSIGPPNDTSAAALLDQIGVVRRLKGDYAGAERYAAEALAIYRESLGPRSAGATNSLNNLAEALRMQNRYDAAEAYYRDALAIRREQFGDEHVEVADNMNNLALLLHARGRLEDAEMMHREALATRRRLLDERHPDVSNSLDDLAFVLADRAKYDEALDLYTLALALRRQTLGPDEPRTVNTLKNMGLLMYRMGRYDEADSLLQQAGDLFRVRLGDEHPSVIGTVRDRAGVLHEQGEYERAEPLYREALELSRKILGDDHRETADVQSDLGGLMLVLGKHTEAEALHREALSTRRKLLGDDHVDVTTSLNTLGVVLLEQDRHREAEPFFREALEIRQNQLGPEHPRVAVPLTGLAAAIRGQRRFAEAEALYRESLRIHRAGLPPGHDRTAHALVGLGTLLTETGDAARAEPLLREAYDTRVRALPEGHWRTAQAASALGEALLAMSRLEEAEPLLRTGYAGLSAVRGPDDRLARRAAATLDSLIRRAYPAGGGAAARLPE